MDALKSLVIQMWVYRSNLFLKNCIIFNPNIGKSESMVHELTPSLKKLSRKVIAIDLSLFILH